MNAEASKGFTLVEVLVSFLLLSFILAGGISIYFNSDTLASLAIHKKMAIEIASFKMEEYKDIDAPNGTVVENIKIGGLDAVRTTTVLDVDEEPDGNVDYKQVTVNVQWVEPGGSTPRTIQLMTYMKP